MYQYKCTNTNVPIQMYQFKITNTNVLKTVWETFHVLTLQYKYIPPTYLRILTYSHIQNMPKQLSLFHRVWQNEPENTKKTKEMYVTRTSWVYDMFTRKYCIKQQVNTIVNVMYPSILRTVPQHYKKYNCYLMKTWHAVAN